MLRENVKYLLEYIESKKDYVNHNYVLNDIFNGNLLPYVLKDLKETVSQSYFNDIKERMIPINILPKLMEKLSKAYMTAPQREPVEENTNDESVIQFYEEDVSFNSIMNMAENYSFLFKGYALEPFIDNGEVGIRPLPYDRFLVWSDNSTNPLKETIFIKFVGKKKIGNKEVEVYFAYTNEEFWAFDENGADYLPAMQDNDGVNPFGIIPFFYGNRGQSLLPTQDTDLLAMTKTVPKLFSDLSGAILYNSFPIVYTVDVDSADLIRSPNAIWDFKSDLNGDKTPQVNTITPQSDITQTLDFIAKSLATWLEMRGIKAGNVGSIDSSNISGISKVMDIVDTLELRKMSQVEMASDEKAFWDKLKVIHNYWIDSGELRDVARFSDDFQLNIVFDEPKPVKTRRELLDEIKIEVEAGFLPKRKAMEVLYPDLTAEQIDEMLEQLKREKPSISFMSPQGDDENGATESNV